MAIISHPGRQIHRLGHRPHSHRGRQPDRPVQPGIECGHKQGGDRGGVGVDLPIAGEGQGDYKFSLKGEWRWNL